MEGQLGRAEMTRGRQHMRGSPRAERKPERTVMSRRVRAEKFLSRGCYRTWQGSD